MSEVRAEASRRALAVIVPARRKALLENVKWMLADGTTLESAAARLGITPRWLVKRLSEMREYEVLRRLRPSFRPHGRSPLVPNGPVVAHLGALQVRGWQLRQIAERSGVHRRVLYEHTHGLHLRIRQHVAGAILGVQGEPPVAGVVDFRASFKAAQHRDFLAHQRKQPREDVA